MAQHKSAKKRIRTNNRKHEHNRIYLSYVRTAIKKFRFSLNQFVAGEKTITLDGLKTLLVSAQSALGKASSKGLMHHNTATRYTSRLAGALNTITKK